MFKSDTLFAKFMNTLCDVLLTGLLWLAFSIPLVTAGAATTAAYYAMSKCVRHNAGYVFSEFWHSFKQNIKATIFTSILFWVLLASIAFEIYAVWIYRSNLNDALFVILAFAAFIVSGFTVYACPVLSRFDKKTFELMKTTAFLFFKFLPLTILAVAVFYAALIAIYLMPWAILVIPGIYMWLLSLPMEKILRRMMPDVPEDSEEGQKWYYQ